MKRIIVVTLINAALLSLISCGSAEDEKAVCVFDKASVYDKPSKKEGKWISSVSLGEKVKFLDDKVDNDDKKKRNYYKVELLDGKEGWIQSDFVALNSVPAVATEKIEIYNRPDLSTITKKIFEPLDIIALGERKEGWVEVTGKRQKGKWIDKGWIKEKGYSEKDRDIAAALFINRAITKPKKEQVVEELRKIQENSDLSGSAFEERIEEIITKLSGNTVPVVTQPAVVDSEEGEE